MARELSPETRAAMQRGGEWLRRQRRKAGYATGGAFAEALGIKQVRLSTYELGQYQVEPEIARRVARVLGMDEYRVWRGLELPLPAELTDSSPVDQIAAVEEMWPGLIDAVVNGRALPPKPPLPDQPRDTKPDTRRRSGESGRSA